MENCTECCFSVDSFAFSSLSFLFRVSMSLWTYQDSILQSRVITYWDRHRLHHGMIGDEGSIGGHCFGLVLSLPSEELGLRLC